jgi:hypothetical protein
MNLSVHLEIVGALLVLLGLSHACFNRFFRWEQELARVSLLTRRIFYVHTFFIALGVVMAGAVSFLYADSLLRPGPLSRAILVGMTAFWLCRLLAQFFAYDSAIWRGDRFRTSMHVVFSLLWFYVTGVYTWALFAIWNDTGRAIIAGR